MIGSGSSPGRLDSAPLVALAELTMRFLMWKKRLLILLQKLCALSCENQTTEWHGQFAMEMIVDSAPATYAYIVHAVGSGA